MAADGVLLLRPDHLGDVLLTLPAVSALRSALPDVRIVYLTGPSVADAARHCPSVDEVLTLPFPDPTAPADPPGWAETVAKAAGEIAGRFLTAVLFRPRDPWSGALVERAGVRTRIGFAHPETAPFLTHPVAVPQGRHVALMAFDLAAPAARSLGADLAPPSWPPRASFSVSEAEEEEAADALCAVAAVGEAPIVLHPGSGWPLKNWPPYRWGSLATAIRRRQGRPALVVGGPSESDLVAAVVEASDGTAVPLPAVLSLGGLAALHRRATVVIGVDSGPVHLAALVGAPVVALYGPFGPDLFAPLSPAGRHRTVRIELPCSPCGTLLGPPCGALTEPACITGISVEQVATAVEDLIGASARRA